MRTTSDIIKFDKEIGIESYVQVWIGVHSNHRDGSTDYHTKATLMWYDLPRDLYERKKWIIRWRIAKFQAMFPRNLIASSLAFYDKKTGFDQEYISARRTVSTYKGQVTKAEKAVEEYKSKKRTEIMFYSEQEDQVLQKALKKVREKKIRLAEAEETLKKYENGPI